MADLRPYLSIVPPRAIAAPEDQLRDAIASAGLTPPEVIHLDGRIHRFASGTTGSSNHKSSKPGWYIAFGDDVPAGRFGCWRAGIEHGWTADLGREMSAVERMAHARRMAEAQAARDAELAKTRQTAAERAAQIWSQAAPASADHPYLRRKGIQPHGARVDGAGSLVAPIYAPDGHLASVQTIAADGSKLYLPGGKVGGAFWTVGSFDAPGVIYVAEGFATAATIAEVSGRPCVVAYSASNLVDVTGVFRERHGPHQKLVVVADHDKSGVGQRYAEQAAAKHGARMVMPPDLGDANDYHLAGGDLSAILDPPVSSWLVPADEFAGQPAPIRWLVKRWLQAEATIMVHGPSGGGKTFVVLDWCLHLAAGLDAWAGYRVHPGPVVYLAGEGHHGLRGRVAAWKHHHGAHNLAMWVSSYGVDLNTPLGYQQAAESIRALPERPALVVVDTVHRHLHGDENSSQDVKTMLDACAAIGREFRCSILYVHHTGVSEEAQHRARGSSAWRGALEGEISVVPAKRPGDPIEIIQRKAKDSELVAPAWVRLVSVEIPGWIDEDGEPVTSAVVELAEAPEAPPKRESDVERFRKVWESAWWDAGAELRDGAPYLTRSALKEKLFANGDTKRSVENALLPGDPKRLIGALLAAEIIARSGDHGWIVSDPAHASAMAIRKNGNG